MSFRFFFILFCFFTGTVVAEPSQGRYFYEGNGSFSIKSKHNGKQATIPYRLANGTYNQKALDQVNAIFGMPKASLGEDVSWRLVSMIDYLEDRFAPGKTLLLLSGYRSPSYNEGLRKKGATAAQTSYHLEGMAADLVFKEAKPKEVWNFVKNLECCGIGHYGGNEIHLDAGRPRFWTKETALSKDNEPPQNRNIYLSIEKDIYDPGEKMRLFFSGVSNYPFGVKTSFELVLGGKKNIAITLEFHDQKIADADGCITIKNRKDARFIFWKIPNDFPGSETKRQIKVEFCNQSFEAMPTELRSRPFVVAAPSQTWMPKVYGRQIPLSKK